MGNTNKPSKIIVDALGGDFSPEETVKGAVLASRDLKETSFVIVGPKDKVNKILEDNKADLSRFELVEASSIVLNNESPVAALKTKKDSSIYQGCRLLKQRDDIGGLVTTGATGAALTGSLFLVGRIEGVERPGLIATLPTKVGGIVRVLDVGANMDSKPSYLLQFALMGSIYLKTLGVEKPKIGLLNVGKEDGKGNELTKEAFKLLSAAGINFVGNVEGDDIYDGVCDIVIADGFSGNVLIKTLEGTAKFVSNAFKGAMMKNVFTKFGSLFQLKQMKSVKGIFEYAKSACAPLLGVNKLVIKAHGKSNADSVRRAILEADKLIQGDLVNKIRDGISASLKQD